MHPRVLEEWSYDADLIVDYRPDATLWHLFKFEWMKLHGDLPLEAELDYPDRELLEQLARNGVSLLDMAKQLDQPFKFVREALRHYGIRYNSVITVDGRGIVKEFQSGEACYQTLATRFRTTPYLVKKTLQMNGEL